MDATPAAPPANPVSSLWWREAPFIASLACAAALFSLLALLGALTDWWWIDESYTWDMLQRPIPQMVAHTARDVHPPLYYLALAGWHRLLPQPRAMKGLSLIAGLGAVLAAGVIGALVRGRRMGALAALLWATFPLLLHHSQEARMYALGLCFETLALAGWALAPRRPRAGWLLMVASLIAALYTHNLCLIFAAALFGGELVRCLAARRTRFTGTGPGWIVSAVLVVGIFYLPWLLMLRRQIQAQALMNFFNAPTWDEVAYKLFYLPYTLKFQVRESDWGWAPGVLMLAVLPALGLVSGLRRRPEIVPPGPAVPARPLAMLLWVGLAPFVFLVLYSRLVNPLFAIDRHGLLFIPFFLLPAAAWLDAAFVTFPRRLVPLLIVGGCAALALAALSRSRDMDLRIPRDALMERAPIGTPIVTYPPVFNYSYLMWSPLPMVVRGDGPPPALALTSCTLVIDSHFSPQREEIKRQARLIVAQARQVREVYTSYDLTAYYLAGLPRRAIDDLLARKPGSGVESAGQLAGRWQPSPLWSCAELVSLLRPAGELLTFSPFHSDWCGLRLATRKAALTMPATAPPGAVYAAVMAGGYYAPSGISEIMRCGLPGAPADVVDLSVGDFLIARLTASSAASLGLQFDLSESLARRQFTPFGDTPPGIYLTWAGVRGLRPEDFRQPGFNGIYLDVGALGDDLFLRSGFNEVEGAPPAEVRWTRGDFVLEAPVWPGQPIREIVLFGILPAQVRQRRLGLRATHAATGRTVEAWNEFTRTDYGEYVLALPEPLAPGIWRLSFTGGTWSPQDAGQGGDPRRLGFYLNAVGLR